MPSYLLADRSLEQAVRRIVGISEDIPVLCTKYNLDLDVHGAHCSTVHASASDPDSGLPNWLVDARAVGMNVSLISSANRPTTEDVLRALMCPPALDMDVTCEYVTCHSQDSDCLQVIQVKVAHGQDRSGIINCRRASDGTDLLVAARDSMVQQGLAAHLPEPLRRLGDEDPVPLELEHAGSESEDESYDPTWSPTFRVFFPDSSPSTVQVTLTAPCSVDVAIRAVSLALPADRYNLFPTVLAADPQPSQWWGSAIALPAWPQFESLVLRSLTTIDGRCFVTQLPSPFDRRQVFRSADLPDNGAFEVFPFWQHQPMDDQQRVEPIHAQSLSNIQEVEGLSKAIPFRRCSQTLMGGKPDFPHPIAEYRCFVVQEAANSHFVPSSRDADLHQEVAAHCGLSTSDTILTVARDWDSDVEHQGYFCEVVCALFARDASQHAEAPLPCITIIDGRSIMMGFSLWDSPTNEVQHSSLVDLLETLAPDGWQAQVHGAEISTEGNLQSFPGCVLVAEFVPLTTSEEDSARSSCREDASSSSGSSDGPSDSPCHSRVDNGAEPPVADGRERQRSRSPRPPAHQESENALSTTHKCRTSGSLWHSLSGLTSVTLIGTSGAFDTTGLSSQTFLGLCNGALTCSLTPRQCKWLLEPEATASATDASVAFLRYASPRLRTPWRYLPPPDATFISEEGDSTSDEEEEDDTLCQLHFAILAHGFALEHAVVEIRLPATIDEAARRVQAGRQLPHRDSFPHLCPACPQPVPGIGIGVFLAKPKWHEHAPSDGCYLCIDATSVDGRLFCTIGPSFLDRTQILLLAGFSTDSPHTVCLGSRDEALEDGELCHLVDGDVVFVLPGQTPKPRIISLGHQLATRAAWSLSLDLPPLSAHNVYCLVHQDGNILHTADYNAPMAYRAQIAAAVGTRMQNIRLYPAVPRVSNAAIEGCPCSTVIAVCEIDIDTLADMHGALLDARVLLQGWWNLDVYQGTVSQARVLEPFLPVVPSDWRLCLRGVPSDTKRITLAPGQVLVEYGRGVEANRTAPIIEPSC